jgi:hypothetical protein
MVNEGNEGYEGSFSGIWQLRGESSHWGTLRLAYENPRLFDYLNELGKRQFPDIIVRGSPFIGTEVPYVVYVGERFRIFDQEGWGLSSEVRFWDGESESVMYHFPVDAISRDRNGIECNSHSWIRGIWDFSYDCFNRTADLTILVGNKELVGSGDKLSKRFRRNPNGEWDII